MLDLAYKTVTVIINKEQNGYVTPDEFNKIAHLVQEKIFKGYFEDHNRDDNRDHMGQVSKGYGNLPYNQRQKINQFSATSTLDDVTGQMYTLPDDLYWIEDDGITSSNGTVVEEVERRELGYLTRSIAKATTCYPVYSRYADTIKVVPQDLGNLNIDYIRKPLAPKWTYFTLPDGNPVFNQAAVDFQDFELHESEFTTIVMEILMFFGINLREAEVVQVANNLSQGENVKENN